MAGRAGPAALSQGQLGPLASCSHSSWTLLALGDTRSSQSPAQGISASPGAAPEAVEEQGYQL